MIDFAPGEDHIFLRMNGMEFYVPELFHLNPNHSTTVPLLISDIHKMQALTDVYGARGFSFERVGFWILNNHPIKGVKIMGRIVGYKEFDRDGRRFIILSIDDTSGKNLILDVKVQPDSIKRAGLVLDHAFGKIVRASGILSAYKKLMQLNAYSFECVGDRSDTHVEIKYWGDCLRYKRQFLSRPWVYTPSKSCVSSSIREPPYKRDARRDIIGSQLLNNNLCQHYHFGDDFSVFENAGPPNGHVIEDVQVLTSTPVLLQVPGIFSRMINHEQLSSISDQQRENEHQIDPDLKSTPATNVSKVCLEIIYFILENNCQPMKLIDIYTNAQIAESLNDLTIQKVTLVSEGQAEDFLLKKHQIFHSIRHNLQVHFGLFSTTKQQVVKPKNLKKLADHIKGCLLSIKVSKIRMTFDVNNYLRLYKHAFKGYIGEDVNYKLINWIIEWFVEFERNDWRYNTSRREWSYVKYQ